MVLRFTLVVGLYTAWSRTYFCRVSSLTIGGANPEMRKENDAIRVNTSLSLLRYQSRRHSIYNGIAFIPFYFPDTR
ncbi:hypothetical protein F5Y08DRAFT_300427 [Xylaria arbuscula]|nr:hypothetical protein F5Y08DRAFT_300427 [Xylaria arbuscula]